MAAPSDERGRGESDRVFCEIEATVVTGFEQIAATDARAKLKAKVETERGHMIIQIPYAEVQKVSGR